MKPSGAHTHPEMGGGGGGNGWLVIFGAIALAVGAGLIVATAVVYYAQAPGYLGGDARTYLAAGERLNAGHPLYALSPGDRPVAISPPWWTVPLVSPPFIAVLPEYAVDFVFTWKAGNAVEQFGSACHAPGATGDSSCSLALANMTAVPRGQKPLVQLGKKA